MIVNCLSLHGACYVDWIDSSSAKRKQLVTYAQSGRYRGMPFIHNDELHILADNGSALYVYGGYGVCEVSGNGTRVIDGSSNMFAISYCSAKKTGPDTYVFANGVLNTYLPLIQISFTGNAWTCVEICCYTGPGWYDGNKLYTDHFLYRCKHWTDRATFIPTKYHLFDVLHGQVVCLKMCIFRVMLRVIHVHTGKKIWRYTGESTIDAKVKNVAFASDSVIHIVLYYYATCEYVNMFVNMIDNSEYCLP